MLPLAAVLKGRTAIGIAHRLHTAHDADRIAVVEDGRVTELGGHGEPIARDGAYARLWNEWNGTADPARSLIVCPVSDRCSTVER